MTDIAKLEAEIERLRAVKTPASAKLLNITKACLDDAEKECERLRAMNAELIAVVGAIARRTWPSTRTHDQSISDMMLANDLARAAIAKADHDG